MTGSHSAHLHNIRGGAAPARARAPLERPSLLRLSAGERALGAIVVIASLWAGVYWALH